MQRDGDHVPFVSSGAYPLRAGNWVRPLVDGQPAFERICSAVEAARKSVWITVAFIERDVQMPGGRGSFFDVLDRAHARGIDVRAIFWRCPELEAVEPGTHFSGTDGERAWLAERGSRFAARWDRAQKLYCHHQKSWLVDAGEPGEIAFVGGINLGKGSLGAPAGHAPNGHSQVHDIYVELRGPSASDVHHNFVQRWNEASERADEHGRWPAASDAGDLGFPERSSPAAGDVPVQIQRTVRRGQYRTASAAPGAESFAIEGGEQSILDQYLRAIANARRSIYLECQAIGSADIVAALDAALAREVEVAFLVPGQPNRQMIEAFKRPESAAFRAQIDALGSYRNFTLLAIAGNAAEGEYEDVYVHSKVALIDDAWCTIGSTNIANRSFFGDTELNVSLWHAPTVRALRTQLIEEHTGIDTSAHDDRNALRLLGEHARANRDRRARRERMQGLAFAVDPSRFARE